MAGYRGDGYGAYGDHGDDDYRFGEGDRRWHGREDDESRHGAAHGNLMGRAEERVRDWFQDEDDGGHRSRRLADDRRATEAADDWRRRYGREGHEGSYGQHDDPYHSFRQRRIEELDRDYRDWCREREQQFHSEFDNWRRQRSSGAGAGRSQQDGRSILADESSGPASGLADPGRDSGDAG